MKAKHTISAIYLDDDEELSLIITDLLIDLGVYVKLFHDPHMALNEMRSNGHVYDLSLIDFRMPMMSGTEVLKEMAKNNFFSIKNNCLFSSVALSEEVSKDFSSKGIHTQFIHRIPKFPGGESKELRLLLEKIKKEKGIHCDK